MQKDEHLQYKCVNTDSYRELMSIQQLLGRYKAQPAFGTKRNLTSPPPSASRHSPSSAPLQFRAVIAHSAYANSTNEMRVE
jgi:hypothetical protein